VKFEIETQGAKHYDATRTYFMYYNIHCILFNLPTRISLGWLWSWWLCSSLSLSHL